MSYPSIPHRIPHALNYCVYHTIGMQQNLGWKLRYGGPELPRINHRKTTLLAGNRILGFRIDMRKTARMFDEIISYNGIKHTFVRSLNSEEPVHILLVGPPGQPKTLFLKCILERFGEKKASFTVGGNASKSGIIDVLFNMQPKYVLVDEIEHLKPEYQTTLLWF